MRTAMVAGVEVALDHWIGGRRVPSAHTFPDLSPIDESHMASPRPGWRSRSLGRGVSRHRGILCVGPHLPAGAGGDSVSDC